jgi:hypothetical protein
LADRAPPVPARTEREGTRTKLIGSQAKKKGGPEVALSQIDESRFFT